MDINDTAEHEKFHNFAHKVYVSLKDANIKLDYIIENLKEIYLSATHSPDYDPNSPNQDNEENYTPDHL